MLRLKGSTATVVEAAVENCYCHANMDNFSLISDGSRHQLRESSPEFERSIGDTEACSHEESELEQFLPNPEHANKGGNYGK